MQEYVNCNLCGGKDTLTLPAYYSFQGQRLGLVKCRTCDLVYVNPRPDAGSLKELYPVTYFERHWDCGCSGETYMEARPRLTSIYRADPLARMNKLGTIGRVLDVGCAGGHFLAAARAEGWEPWGVEINPAMAETARQQGFSVYQNQLPECCFPDGFFTAVNLGDVLEHLPDPMGTLMEAYRVLAAGGIVAVHAPVSYAKLTLDWPVFQIEVPPYHIYEFTLPTLKAMVEKAGFTVRETTVDWLPETPAERRTTDNIERMSLYAQR